MDSYFILREPGLIRTVTDKGLVLFTYGEDNNNTENIELQKKNGVAAVIYDRSAVKVLNHSHDLPPLLTGLLTTFPNRRTCFRRRRRRQLSSTNSLDSKSNTNTSINSTGTTDNIAQHTH